MSLTTGLRRIVASRLSPTLALMATLVLLPVAPADAEGPVTSRLSTARFALMKGWWSADHNDATPVNFNKILELARAQGARVDTVTLGLLNQPITAAGAAALSDTGLAKYDVMVWYNVLRLYHNVDAATRNRIQAWYDNNNRGLGCFHQCVRASDDGILNQGPEAGWPWWEGLLGTTYRTNAPFATIPVYLDSGARFDVYGSYAPPGDSIIFNDEWYQYRKRPDTVNTRHLLHLRRATIPTQSNWVSVDTMGTRPVVAWVRDHRGGRFSMNGMFHGNGLATATNPALRAFYDSTIVGTLRYLAGYDGCKDPNYVEYNPKATHQPSGACATPLFISVAGAGDSKGIRLDDFKIGFSQPGAHRVEIYATTGSRVATRRGEGMREYRFRELNRKGVYYVRMTTAAMKTPYVRRIVLL